MTEEAILESAQPDYKTKKIVDRSAAYPNFTLIESFDFVSEIFKNFPTTNRSITRDDVGAIFKTKSHNKQREVSCAAQFDFLSKERGSYKISDLFRSLRNAFEAEKPKLWLNAFQSPKLYRDLIDKFDGHAIPTELVTHLIRYHNIAEKAAPEAAKLFIENATFCKALGENGILNFNQAVGDPNFKIIETGNNLVDNNHKDKIKENNIPPQQAHRTLEIPSMVNSDKITIRLTNGRTAYLEYPKDITVKDVNILQKQVEQLQIIAEST